MSLEEIAKYAGLLIAGGVVKAGIDIYQAGRSTEEARANRLDSRERTGIEERRALVADLRAELAASTARAAAERAALVAELAGEKATSARLADAWATGVKSGEELTTRALQAEAARDREADRADRAEARVTQLEAALTSRNLPGPPTVTALPPPTEGAPS